MHWLHLPPMAEGGGGVFENRNEKLLTQYRPDERLGRVGAAVYLGRKYGISASEIVKKEQVDLRYVLAIAEIHQLELRVRRDNPDFRYYFGVALNPTIPAFIRAVKLVEDYHAKVESESGGAAAE